ncbi:hypothetical protein AY601_0946 [Pedobacter cryoconitis]|uniref:Uncharacterized protein n=1 Tax=Pedobacter cryoconitis TaxID=188932 RepID=A0A127V9E2_9SPHI|nr:hypothetical protein [Pedobacter cryoconitis]AMP97885.1 hypothetical protein AY601_0946 [Pedobacter cryoconitis]
MNTQEIQEQLQDNQELTIKLGERMSSAEEILAKLMYVKDYSGQLDELKELIIKNAEQDKTAPIQEEISQQIIATQKLMLSSEASIKKQEVLFKNFPKEMRVKLLHRFEDKTKGFMIGGLVLFALSAVSIGLCVYLWNDNGRMKDNDIKFRIVRQMVPNIAYKADTLYYRDPKGIEKKTKQLEAQQLTLAEVESAAKKTAKEAAEVKKEAKRLKKRKGKL